MQKRGWRIIYEKRAEQLFPTVLFVLLNLAFFSILIIFIWKASTGALIYEQAYAKEIALFIDEAKPLMEISIDFSKGLEIAEKNKFSKDGIIKINPDTNEIIVKLSSSGDYKTKYFSDYGVETKFDGSNLVLTIREKTDKEKIEQKKRIILKKYTDEQYKFDFSSSSLGDVEKAVLYAKANQVGERKCSCGSNENCIKYAGFITEASTKNNIDDPLLLLALMMQESSCSGYDTCNFAGYCGLMQIPRSVSGWANPGTNINEGARILREKYESDKNGKIFQGCSNRNIEYSGWSAALRGYNGWGCGKDASGNLIYSQDVFVEEVLDIYRELKKQASNQVVEKNAV